MGSIMKRFIPMSICAALLSGCGLAETAATGAATGAGAAQQVEDGKKMQEQVRSDIDAAQQQAAEARKAAEAAATSAE
jgi:hypothetical protein